MALRRILSAGSQSLTRVFNRALRTPGAALMLFAIVAGCGPEPAEEESWRTAAAAAQYTLDFSTTTDRS
ncbi:hypothetical protein KHT87_22840, partial [Alkalihalobacillus clausii]|uniref:hypothetical protein n=1 Tax=Shouchella clausii TaxID=79880 RepID=UPI001C0DC874